MKLFTYLFGFYLLALTVIPCDPKGNCCEEEIAAKSQTNLPARNNKPEFPCSPFFACGANHGIVIADFQIKIDQPVKLTRSALLFSSESAISATLSSIWQPPKLD